MKRIGVLLVIFMIGLLIFFVMHSSIRQVTLGDALDPKDDGSIKNGVEQINDGTTKGVLNETPLLPVLHCYYFDLAAFKTSFKEIQNSSIEGDSEDNRSNLNNQKENSAIENNRIIGGILPHHLVAESMIARFFNTLQEELSNAESSSTVSPETIIVLAPNHKRVGDRPLHTGAFSWDTPFGQVDADEKMVEELIKTFKAGVNPTLLEEEHSISALIPYIHFTFPKAKIVPILIHGNMNRKDCAKLSEFLVNSAQDTSCLLLASIDFSHGLRPEEAIKHDEVTQRVIETRDYETLFGLGNTYLDAPPTLGTFLMTMDSLNGRGQKNIKKDSEHSNLEYGKGDLLEHGEASQFLKQYVSETTSYMTYIFTGQP